MSCDALIYKEASYPLASLAVPAFIAIPLPENVYIPVIVVFAFLRTISESINPSSIVLNPEAIEPCDNAPTCVMLPKPIVSMLGVPEPLPASSVVQSVLIPPVPVI